MQSEKGRGGWGTQELEAVTALNPGAATGTAAAEQVNLLTELERWKETNERKERRREEMRSYLSPGRIAGRREGTTKQSQTGVAGRRRKEW